MDSFKCVFLAIILFVQYTWCKGTYVQIDTHGTIDYCNSNTDQYTIPSLSPTDAPYISNLRQVQLFTRHGSRTTSDALTNYFPQALISKYNMQFNCSISTQTSRIVNHDIDTAGDLISLNKHFIKDQQLVEGNCEAGQSVSQLIKQHTINGKHIYDRYFDYTDNSGSSSGSGINDKLMNETILYDIFNNIEETGSDSRFILRSTNIERTLASAMVLVTSIFKQLGNDSNGGLNTQQMDDIKNGISNIIIDCLTHDENSDAYLPSNNENVGEYIFASILLTFVDNDFYSYWNSDETVSVRDAYYALTNITFSYFTAIGYYPAYCDGLKIPMNATLFDQISITFDMLSKLFWQCEYNGYNSTNKTRKPEKYQVYQLLSSPMRYIISQYLENATSSSNTNEEYQFVYHSFHDTSILDLLGGLGISDGVWPIYAETVILEIYTINNDYINLFPSGYGFRLLRNGNIIKFANCSNMIENGMELCDVNIIANILKDGAMPLKTWEDYVYNMFNSGESSETTTTTTTTSEPITGCGNNTVESSSSNKSNNSNEDNALIEGIFIGIGCSLVMLGVFALCTVCYYRRKKSREPQSNMYNQM